MVDTSNLIDTSALESIYGANFSWEILILAIVVLVFKLFWYGLALYKTVERKQKGWFIALFILALAPISELGIIAIIYLLIYREKKSKKKR
ncbi:MAG: DUF5652 family protein [Nanoarchaeota archaeon]|nr:DUF5652 family protein [Nanoarchaeota archaeon]